MADLVWQMLGSYPVLAYSPSLLNSTVEAEVQRLKRLVYHRGKYVDLANIDLFGRHDNADTVFLSLSRGTPHGAPFIGEVIVGGNLYCPYLEYVAMGQVIEALGGCAISVLDDSGKILRDQVFVLTRNHHLVGITPE